MIKAGPNKVWKKIYRFTINTHIPRHPPAFFDHVPMRSCVIDVCSPIRNVGQIESCRDIRVKHTCRPRDARPSTNARDESTALKFFFAFLSKGLRRHIEPAAARRTGGF